MRVLVIGYGSIGKRHAANAKALGHAVAICDPAILTPPDGDWSEEGHRVWLHDDDALADGQYAAVVIATPASTHAALLSKVLRRTRASVLVEKPLALSIEDLWSNTDGVVFADQKRVSVGYNLRFHPGLVAFAAAAFSTVRPARGAPEAVHTARFWVMCGRTWPGTGYASFLLEASHEIDLALTCFGAAQCVGAMSRHDATWQILLRHDAGTLTHVQLNGSYDGYSRGAEATGPAGTVTWTWDPTPGFARSSLSGVGVPEGQSYVAFDIEQTYRDELGAFLAPLGGDHFPSLTPATWQDGVKVLAICDEVARRCAYNRKSPLVNRLTYGQL